jgi:Melibiase/Glycosyl hydrolase family 36 C-terminal domain
MKNLKTALLCALCFAPLSRQTAAALQQQDTLRSAETIMTAAAEERAPRMLEMRLTNGPAWLQLDEDRLIDCVYVGQQRQPLHWRFNRSLSIAGASLIRYVYDSSVDDLRLSWEWRRRAEHGPLEHTIRIENLGKKEVWIPLQESLRLTLSTPETEKLEQLWVEKGAGGPSDAGTHRVAIAKGFQWTGTSSTYAHPAEGQQREMIPYVLVDAPGEDGAGWYAGIEFSGRTRIDLRRNENSVAVDAGLNSDLGPFRTRLAPGETFETPTVFVGAFRGGPDAAANTLRRWVREVLNNPITVADPQFPLVVNNSWGSGMAIDAEQARRMIRDSAELGFEMFHLDAGWFRGVGDWYPDEKKFPEGLAPIADYAHSLGLRFGLWMDWAQAGWDKNSGALNINDPATRNWLTTLPREGWRSTETFKAVTLDLGVPAARDWAATTVHRVVRDYHLDMLEHDGYVVAQGCDRKDHPHAAPDPMATRRYQDSGFWWVESANSTDVSYHATRAYYDIYSKLRDDNPRLLLEICNDGGRMVDFGSAAHGDYFSISDAYDPLSNRRAFYDASYVLPPAMLETYVMKVPTPTLGSFISVLRSGMMGWFTLMLDTTAWTPAEHAAAKQAIALYKSRLRPLIREADLYHVSDRPDGVHWDGMEYFDAVKQRGVLFAFHGSLASESEHDFRLQGLDAAARYRLTYIDHTSKNAVVSGGDLMKRGLTVRLAETNTSELVFFEKVEQ